MTSSGRPVPSSGWKRVRVVTIGPCGPSATSIRMISGRRSYETTDPPFVRCAFDPVRAHEVGGDRDQGLGVATRVRARPDSRPPTLDPRALARQAIHPRAPRSATLPGHALRSHRVGARWAIARTGRRRSVRLPPACQPVAALRTRSAGVAWLPRLVTTGRPAAVIADAHASLTSCCVCSAGPLSRATVKRHRWRGSGGGAVGESTSASLPDHGCARPVGRG